MPTTQYIPTTNANGTSNLMCLLGERDRQVLRLIMPRDLEKVFGQGIADIYEQERGYTEPEWYFQSSDGCVWGIGWRWGSTRLRGRINNATQAAASEFVKFINRELMGA